MLDAKTLSLIQEQQNRDSAKRSGKSGLRLLDDNENNVGNATIIDPEVIPPGVILTTVKQPAPPRILNLTAESKTGQSVTVVMTGARLPNAAGFGGPLTGIIEFGNGTQFTRIEFDIPLGPYQGSLNIVAPGTQPEDSGAVIQVPTGIIRAYARYDNAYVTPELQGIAFGGPGSSAFPAAVATNGFPTQAAVKAFANYFGRHHTKLYKTLYLFDTNGAPVTFAEGNAPVLYSIPPFAKSIRVIRDPETSSMTLAVSDQIGLAPPFNALGPESYILAAGPTPTIPITGNQNTFSLVSTALADTVRMVKVVFEIGF